MILRERQPSRERVSMRGGQASVAVVGGGLGGLASACVLAARGHRVTLYDKNSWSGGKAAVLHEGGFRFDMGPTILTVPRVLDRIFSEARRDLNTYLDLHRRGRGLPDLSAPLRPPARRLRPLLLLEAGGGPVRHHQRPRQLQPRDPAR